MPSAERVIVYDGATGTALQRAELDEDDFGGPDYDGCFELLNVNRPDVIADLHAGYFEVGADVVETNTFGAFAVPLGEYGIAARAQELAHAAASIAAGVAADYSTPDRRRFVAGSMGPGTKLPSLGQIGYVELRDAYEPLAIGLLEGGVNLFIIETMYDLLTVKAAVAACRRAMTRTGRQVPLQVQVTIETTGRMLPGTEIGAALAAIEPLRPDVIGLNCATGPEEMDEHLRYLSRHSRVPISVIPNAGLPEVRDGEMVYDLTPAALAEHQARFIEEYGVRVVGGCCGTSEAHIAAVVERCSGLEPASRRPEHQPGAASLYSFTPFRQDTSFLIVGERTNANGSKQFREAMLDEDWDACVAVARSQVAESAHLIDVCVDYVGRDGAADMGELAGRFATQVPVPPFPRFDRTRGDGGRAAAPRRAGGAQLGQPRGRRRRGLPGRSSVSPRPRIRSRGVFACSSMRRGQARDVDWKLRVAHRLHDLATNRYGLAPSELIFDPLTFPLTTGDPDLRRDAIETIEAIKRIKEELPGRVHHPGYLQHLFWTQPGSAPRPQLHVPARMRQRRLGRRHRARGPDHAPQPHRRRPSADLPRPHPRPARHLRPARSVDRGLLRRGRFREHGGGSPGLAGGRAAAAPHRRRGRRRARARSRRSLAGALGAGHHQLRSPRRDEDGRGPVRLGRYAAAVRAAFRRDDESRGGAPRAAHGEGRCRRPRLDRARHRQRRRSRHRQEPGRHHPHQTTGSQCTTSASRWASTR